MCDRRDNFAKGKLGEDLAAEFLSKKGYKILLRNYKNKYGEIDIIALNRTALVFIEVKARTSTFFGRPEEAVNYTKQKRITNAAEYFLSNNSLPYKSCRFDVISINLTDMEVSHIENAFLSA